MVNLCALTGLALIATVLPYFFSATAFSDSCEINYNATLTNITEILEFADTLYSAVYNLTLDVNNTRNSLENYGINATTFATLNQTYWEIRALAANATAMNANYQAVLSQIINATNSQINSVIDQLQCFQNATSCHPAPGPCYDNPCKNGATCQPIGSQKACICAQGFTGETCETFACGPEIINVSPTPDQMRSLNFPDLISGYNCTWILQANQSYQVELTINSVRIIEKLPGRIWFEVIDVNSMPPRLQKFNTSTSASNQSVSSAQARLEVTFKTGNALSDGSPGSFDLSYRAVYFDPCIGVVCGNGGTCVSSEYKPGCRCTSCFTGNNCTLPVSDPCIPFGAVCGDHGTCGYDPSTCINPSCQCEPQWTGMFCDQPL